jgi:hypothetical protein
MSHLQQVLNNPAAPWPAFEAVANQGTNVFSTLNAISQMVLERFWHQTNGAPPPAADPALTGRSDPGTPMASTSVVAC